MNDVVQWAALAPLLALVGSLINAFFGRSLKEPLPGIIASLAVAAGFVLAVWPSSDCRAATTACRSRSGATSPPARCTSTPAS